MTTTYTPRFTFYAVAEYQAASAQAADMIAARAVAVGLDDMVAEHPDHTVLVNAGPFQTTTVTDRALQDAARAYLSRTIGDVGTDPLIVNATPADDIGAVREFL